MYMYVIIVNYFRHWHSTGLLLPLCRRPDDSYDAY